MGVVNEAPQRSQRQREISGISTCAWRLAVAYRCGDADAGGFWEDNLGEEDFLRPRGDRSLEGEETLPERSSEVTDLLALWELSDRSLNRDHTPCTLTVITDTRQSFPLVHLITK